MQAIAAAPALLLAPVASSALAPPPTRRHDVVVAHRRLALASISRSDGRGRAVGAPPAVAVGATAARARCAAGERSRRARRAADGLSAGSRAPRCPRTNSRRAAGGAPRRLYCGDASTPAKLVGLLGSGPLRASSLVPFGAPTPGRSARAERPRLEFRRRARLAAPAREFAARPRGGAPPARPRARRRRRAGGAARRDGCAGARPLGALRGDAGRVLQEFSGGASARSHFRLCGGGIAPMKLCHALETRLRRSALLAGTHPATPDRSGASFRALTEFPESFPARPPGGAILGPGAAAARKLCHPAETRFRAPGPLAGTRAATPGRSGASFGAPTEFPESFGGGAREFSRSFFRVFSEFSRSFFGVPEFKLRLFLDLPPIDIRVSPEFPFPLEKCCPRTTAVARISFSRCVESL